MSLEKSTAEGYCTWEEAVKLLRADPLHSQFMYDAYLTEELTENCERFARSKEFSAILKILKAHAPDAREILDIPGGNGIATIAFASNNYQVTTVEPNPSDTVGRAAIQSTLNKNSLHATVVDAYGEDLPFADASFDVVFVRQGLHHASKPQQMFNEYYCVLKAEGLLLACREHVVNDHDASLRKFLAAQPDHQLYGGENAFTLAEYRSAIRTAGFFLLEELGPYSSEINLHPATLDDISNKVIDSPAGKALSFFLPKSIVAKLGLWLLKYRRADGRLFSFVARKAAGCN